MAEGRYLRVALLGYRSKPHSGGQGVYVRHLTRELARAGHTVTVFSGQPYPALDHPDVRLEKVPSLDLYRDDAPFRTPARTEFRDLVDVREYLGMRRGEFPEPLTFGMRIARELRSRAGEFDVVHDNQSLAWGLLPISRRFPSVVTIHHPITLDRDTELAAAPTPARRRRIRRWYSFLPMQEQVARRASHVITVSQFSAEAITRDFGVDPARIRVVPLGVQTDVFTLAAAPQRVPGRIVAVATQDTPIKGVDVLLRAAARLRDRNGEAFELVMVLRPTPGGLAAGLVRELGLERIVRFEHGLSAPQMAALLASATVACTPSRFEGFSLPTLEAMSCGTPLVVTRAGAVPEVVGDGEAGDPCALVVPSGDDTVLADALERVLADSALRDRLGEAGRARAVATYDWARVAEQTAQVYEEARADSGG